MITASRSTPLDVPATQWNQAKFFNDFSRACARVRARRGGFGVTGNVLFRKMFPDAFPLLVAEPNHSTFIADRDRPAILR
jgi:hypothetical protein